MALTYTLLCKKALLQIVIDLRDHSSDILVKNSPSWMMYRIIFHLSVNFLSRVVDYVGDLRADRNFSISSHKYQELMFSSSFGPAKVEKIRKVREEALMTLDPILGHSTGIICGSHYFQNNYFTKRNIKAQNFRHRWSGASAFHSSKINPSSWIMSHNSYLAYSPVRSSTFYPLPLSSISEPLPCSPWI